jgi:PTS system glucose-specific IIA component
VSLQVLAPVTGRAVGLAAVPDQVFAQAIVGPGSAIDPLREPGEACSPVSGVLVKLHPHAFVVVGADGYGVLVHLGIDTVQLHGDGFTLLAAEGDTVQSADPLIRWDPAAVEASGRSPVCPVIALDARPGALRDICIAGEVAAGDLLFVWD